MQNTTNPTHHPANPLTTVSVAALAATPSANHPYNVGNLQLDELACALPVPPLVTVVPALVVPALAVVPPSDVPVTPIVGVTTLNELNVPVNEYAAGTGGFKLPGLVGNTASASIVQAPVSVGHANVSVTGVYCARGVPWGEQTAHTDWRLLNSGCMGTGTPTGTTTLFWIVV
jgi:hypothetical protein